MKGPLCRAIFRYLMIEIRRVSGRGRWGRARGPGRPRPIIAVERGARPHLDAVEDQLHARRRGPGRAGQQAGRGGEGGRILPAVGVPERGGGGVEPVVVREGVGDRAWPRAVEPPSRTPMYVFYRES
jgi:hypothetical protein